ncbi:MAG: hypothetical protein ACRESZ_07075 [Methylococcales bacterium]
MANPESEESLPEFIFIGHGIVLGLKSLARIPGACPRIAIAARERGQLAGFFDRLTRMEVLFNDKFDARIWTA